MTPQPTAIPRTLLAPSPTNPRKHFDAARLAEMHASIQRHGILQPLLVRRNAQAEGAGQPLYEIVSGERRWRASEGTFIETALPCHVLELDDLAVLEIQVIENVQREDLHPLEEAEGYEHLLLDPTPWAPHERQRLAGYTIDEIAQRVGKSKSHVYARLRLLGLTPAARHAFVHGEFSTGSALQIARLNTMHQEELVQALLHDAEKGAPWSADTVSQTVQQRYMLRLAGAPFGLHDAGLLPAAGACSTCPKRSGANPELFDDIAEGDTCADRACFALKCEAHEVAAITLAEERGHSIIQGDEAARLLPSAEATVKGYLRLDRPSEFALSHKPLGEVLGDSARQVALIVRSHGAGLPSTLVEVMPTPIVRQVLKEMGLLKPDATPVVEKAKARETKPPRVEVKTPVSATKAAGGEAKPTECKTPLLPEPLQRYIDGLAVMPLHLRKAKQIVDTKKVAHHKKQRIQDLAALLLAHQVGLRAQSKGISALSYDALARPILEQTLFAIDFHLRPLLACLAGLPPPVHTTPRDADNWIWSLDNHDAGRVLLVTLALFERDDSHPERSAEHALSDLLQIDTAELHERAELIVSAKLTAELAATAPKAKPAAAKNKPNAPATKKPGVKYRSHLTGETWSGRGLQPKWLKAALALGHKLSDFDVHAKKERAASEPAQAAVPTPAPQQAKAQLSTVAAWPFPNTGAADSAKITALQLDAARKHVIATRSASLSGVQRALTVGYAHAARILEALEQQQVVGPAKADGQREVLVTESAA